MKKITAILALVALVLCGCAQETAPAPELLTPVGSQLDTAVAQMGIIEDVDVFEAAIVPEYTELYFTEETRVGNVPVMMGDAVKAGDVLVEIDTSAVNASIAALEGEKASIEREAAYEKAVYDIDMEIFALELKKLSGDDAYDFETDMAIYELEYSNAEKSRNERLAVIETELEELRSSLENAALVSPCDGRVTYVANEYSIAGAYDTVCVVTDDNDLTLKSNFIQPAVLASCVETYAVIDGEKLEITPMALNEDEYSRAALRKVQFLTSFEAQLPDSVKAGDTCVVYMVAKRTENVLRVPVNSVFTEDDEYYVYVMDGDSRIKTGVSIGETNNIYTEITSGIEEGAVVYVGN